jgi:hypothetical protein
MSSNSSNKKSSGWNINEDKFDPDEHSRQVTARDEAWGMGRISDDTVRTPGGLRKQLEDLANSNTAEVNEILAEHGITNSRVPVRFFLSDQTPCVVYLDDSGWRATAYTREGEVQFTAATRDGVMLLAEQSCSTHKQPRALNDQERLRVARLVLSGATPAAVELYVELSLDTMPHRSAEEVLNDPALVPVLNSGARFVWTISRRDYSGDDEFEVLLDKVSSTKPMNLYSIDCLYDRFLDEKAAAARSTRPPAPVAEPETERQPAPTPEEIEAALQRMSDAELGKLRLRTLQHRGHAIRKFDERMGVGVR